MKAVVFSMCDGWQVELRNPEGDKVIKSYFWGHNDDEGLCGGAKYISEMLNFMGYDTELEGVY